MDVVRITELQPKTYVEQGDYIAIDNQSDGTKKVQFTNLLDDTLSQENKIAPANVVGNEIATVRDEVEDEIATIRAAVGSPLKASTVAQMTDKNKIYVYVGSESGYTNGNWYYWNGSAWTSGGVYNSVAVVTDPTLTLSGVPADAKATGDEIGNLKSDFNYNKTIPKQLAIGDYVNTLEMYFAVISDQIIPAGSYVDSIIVHSGTNTSSTAMAYLFNEDGVCIEKRTFTCVNGKNVVPFGFYADVNCKVGVYGVSPLYTNSAVSDDYLWSQGLKTFSPQDVPVGNSVTVSQSYPSSKFTMAVFAVVYSGVTKETTVLDNESGYYNKVIPDVWDDPFVYNTGVSGSAFVVSGVDIPSGSLIKAIKYYSTSASESVYLYAIDKSTRKVKYYKYTSAQEGWNIEPISYLCDSDCIIGIYGAVLICRKATPTSGVIDSRKVFSTGLLTADIKPAQLGDVLTITQTDSANVYALPIQVEYTENITAYYEMRNVIPTAPTCYASFIDDDSGANTPSLWGEIIENTNIRMGFACITGVMAGEVEPTIQTVPMTLEQLKSLYNAGHEVYSHSWDHSDFASNSTTVPMIVENCYKSKDWLLTNGFYRGSNIIVYPGGMGETTTPKQNAVKQFFEYGVDAWGGGLNPLPIKKTRIVRINADTSTLESMKASVDMAVEYKCLIVFMNHSYEMIDDRTAQIAKMESLISYIQSKGIEILPLGEALNRIYR